MFSNSKVSPASVLIVKAEISTTRSLIQIHISSQRDPNKKFLFKVFEKVTLAYRLLVPFQVFTIRDIRDMWGTLRKFGRALKERSLQVGKSYVYKESDHQEHQ